MMISTGEVVHSATGRKLSPAPKIDCTSDRKCLNTIKRIHEWLKKEAIEECKAVGNELALLLVSNIDLKNVSPSDVDEMILFDKEFAGLSKR
jgi:hypothetical protein